MARHEQVQGDNRAPTTQSLVVQRVDGIRGMLAREDVVKQLAGVVPSTLSKSLTPDRIARLAMIAVLKSEKLQKCNPKSIATAVITLAAWGLEPSGVTGEAYLVPFKDECTPIPGYQGLITLALRSEHVLSMSAQLVYEHDAFRMNIADNSPILHEPSWEDDRGRLLGGYAVAYLRGGGVVKERMTIGELNAIRARSPSFRYNSGPWVTDPEQMYRKSLIRRLSKYVPKSPELVEAFAAEDEYERVIDSRERLAVTNNQPFGFTSEQQSKGEEDVQGERSGDADASSEDDWPGDPREE